jgi:simple sugar transport system permease protein
MDIDFGILIPVVLSSTLRMAVPLILAATGGSFSMRSGVSDLGSEGMMLAGSFFGVWGAFLSGNAWIGVLFGMVFGALFSLVHGLMHITYRVNATISGMCVNLLGMAVTPLMLDVIWGMNGKSPQVRGFTPLRWNWLMRIPIVGDILGSQSILFYLAVVLSVLGWIFMFKTSKGLRMRTVGENPQAASTVGLNVPAYKYFGVIMSGVFCGMGGAYLSLAQLNLFVEGMSAGRGYIAVVINAFGRYNPIGVMLGSIFFGFFASLQTIFQDVLPSQLVMMVPYLITLLVITFGIRKSAAPAGVGKYHDV